MIAKKQLEKLYLKQNKSMQEIADVFRCSVNKVVYWMKTNNIPRRSWSEATYVKRNPHGDPFKFRKPRSFADHQLMGMGIGLYWGEGTKANKCCIRLGNTDPELINTFIEFLKKIFGIDKEDLRFSLQIFTDIEAKEALNYWTKFLKVDKKQFQKPVITKSGSLGTYRKKSKYGVVTVHYNNKKARDLLISLLPM